MLFRENAPSVPFTFNITVRAMDTRKKIRNYLAEHDSFARGLDIAILEADSERSVAIMPLEPRHRNAMGNAHGGAIFALADMTFGAASNAAGLFWVNAQSSISYLNPGRLGPLRGEARPVRTGRTLCVYEVRITDGDDTLVAIATITGYNTRKNIPVEGGAEHA